MKNKTTLNAYGLLPTHAVPIETHSTPVKFKSAAHAQFGDLTTAKAILLVNLNKPECSGLNLTRSVLHAVKTYQTVSILLVDALHWRNIRANHSQWKMEQCMDNAHKLGAQWMQEHIPMILNACLESKLIDRNVFQQLSQLELSEQIKKLNTLNVKINFFRWMDWIKQDSVYEKNATHIQQFLDLNKNFLKAIEEDAQSFLSRHITFDKEDVLYYLREESAAIIWIGARCGYNFIVYPGEELKCFRAARKLLIQSDQLKKNATYDHEEIIQYCKKPAIYMQWSQVIFLPTKKNDTIINHTHCVDFKQKNINDVLKLIACIKNQMAQYIQKKEWKLIQLLSDQLRDLMKELDVLCSLQSKTQESVMSPHCLFSSPKTIKSKSNSCHLFTPKI